MTTNKPSSQSISTRWRRRAAPRGTLERQILHRLVRSGRIPCTTDASGRVLVKASDLKALSLRTERTASATGNGQ